jgi:hypothetical protein
MSSKGSKSPRHSASTPRGQCWFERAPAEADALMNDYFLATFFLPTCSSIHFRIRSAIWRLFLSNITM